MNHKTIRAYQFKADEAVRTLEEAGAQWVVGKGKPHWKMPVTPQENLENMRQAIREDFAKIIDKNIIAAMAEMAGVVKPEDAPTKAVPVEDSFELGPQTFPNRHQYLDKFAQIRKIPSWHKLAQVYAGSIIQVTDITFISRSRYKGYCVVFKIGTVTAWLPLSCIEFKL